MGWSGFTNGCLLSLMASEKFDLFITGDRNLQFQQKVAGAQIAVVVLAAQSTRLIHTQPLMQSVLAHVGSIQPGTVITFPVAQRSSQPE